MKPVTPEQKITEAKREVEKLLDSQNLKKLPEDIKDKIAKFYEEKSRRRMETAALVFSYSSDAKKRQTGEVSKEYADYSEVVVASYYAMYYIVHAYIAKKYAVKIGENLRGVHVITHNLVLYYLVNTNKLAAHLYEEYKKTMETTAELQKISIDDFQEKAFWYAEKYAERKAAREKYTYYVTRSAEEHHAKRAQEVAQEFIQTIRELMIN